MIPTAADASCWVASSQASGEDALGVGEPAALDADGAVEAAPLGGPVITVEFDGLGEADAPVLPGEALQAAIRTAANIKALIA